MDQVQNLISEGKFDDAIKLLEPNLSDPTKIEEHVQLAELWIATGETEKGTDLLSKVVETSRTDNNLHLIAKAVIVDASTSFKTGEFEVGLSKLQKFEVLFMELNPTNSSHLKVLASFYNVRGTLYAFSKKFDKAEKDGNKAIELLTKLSDHLTIARTGYNLGALFYRDHLINFAQPFLEISNEAVDKIDNPLLSAHIKMELGALYQEVGSIEKAISCFEKQFEIFHSTDNEENKAWAYSDLGNGNRGYGLINESDQLLMKGLELYEKGQDKRTLANHLTYLGLNQDIQGNLGISSNYYQRALDLYTELEDDSKVLEVKIRLAELRVKENKLKESIELVSAINESVLSEFHKLLLLKVKSKLYLNDSNLMPLELANIEKFTIPEYHKIMQAMKIMLEIRFEYGISKQIDNNKVKKLLQSYLDFEIFREAMLWNILDAVKRSSEELEELILQFSTKMKETGVESLLMTAEAIRFVHEKLSNRVDNSIFQKLQDFNSERNYYFKMVQELVNNSEIVTKDNFIEFLENLIIMS